MSANISELKMSEDEIIQSSPSELDQIHEVFEDLRGNKAEVFESHVLAGSLQEIQRSAGDSLVLDERFTTDLLEDSSDLRGTCLPKALESNEPAGLPSVAEDHSEELHVAMDAQSNNLSTLADSVATEGGSHTGPVPTTIASYESPTFSYYIGFMSASPAVTPAAASEKYQNEPDSSTTLVQPEVEIIHDLEDSVPSERAVSMPDIAVKFGEVESVGILTKRSESINSLEPKTDVDCNGNEGTETTITPISSRRRRTLWSRTKRFVRRLICCGAKNMPLD